MTEVVIRGRGEAGEHAGDLVPALRPMLAEARAGAVRVDFSSAPDALTDWATSGAMLLTGARDAPPLASRGRPASAVRAALALARALAAGTGLAPPPSDRGPRSRRWPDPGLLSERAALSGLTRRAPRSCGGALRIVPAGAGWLALSLGRPDDVAFLPALVQAAVDPDDPWTAVADWAREQSPQDAAERAQLLGLAAAAIEGRDGDPPGDSPRHSPRHSPEPTVQDRHRQALVDGAPWLVATPGGPRRPAVATGRLPLVLDLSALWAGPLAAQLLGLAGARVVKVESTHRPDGLRQGPPVFYDLLHAGAASVAVDLRTAQGVDELRQLIRAADVVIESARPRALRALGVLAEEAVAEGTIWLSITAQGRTGPWSNRVGFGDDVALGAGLRAAGPLAAPAGDAIADPLTGVHALLAIVAALTTGRGWLLDVAMHQVAALSARGPVAEHRLVRRGRFWFVETAAGPVSVARPHARRPVRAAAALGADNERYLPALLAPARQQPAGR
jgi:hypothetical protein